MKNLQVKLNPLFVFLVIAALWSCKSNEKVETSTTDTADTTMTQEQTDESSSESYKIQDERLIGEWSYADKMAGSFMGDATISANEIAFKRMGTFTLEPFDAERNVFRVQADAYEGQIEGIQYFQLYIIDPVDENPDGVDEVMRVSLYLDENDAREDISRQSGVFYKYGVASAIDDFAISDDSNINVIAPDGKREGVYVGGNISTLMEKGILKKDILQTGEGDFEIFNIYDKNHGKLGYVMESHEEKDKIAELVINNEKAHYFDVRIGDKWTDVLKHHPNAIAHGSEIEGYVCAKIGNHLVALDHRDWNYELDQSTIPAGTRVVEILCR